MPGVEILNLLKEATGASEAYQVTEYVVCRETRGGGMEEVRIEVRDGGPAMGNLRFSVIAKSEDGRTATGNPAGSLETVLATVHWYDLD